MVDWDTRRDTTCGVAGFTGHFPLFNRPRENDAAKDIVQSEGSARTLTLVWWVEALRDHVTLCTAPRKGRLTESQACYWFVYFSMDARYFLCCFSQFSRHLHGSFDYAWVADSFTGVTQCFSGSISCFCGFICIKLNRPSTHRSYTEVLK